MRISWRDLDWIPEPDRNEIQRRMETLDGKSGLLERVDFSARKANASGSFEIRITANAAKRQIIAIRRDSQRARAFYSAFEALERGIVSVLAAQQSSGTSAAVAARAPTLPRQSAAKLSDPAGSQALGSLGKSAVAAFGGRVARQGARAALPLLGASLAMLSIVAWFQMPDSQARSTPDPTEFSAVALPASEQLPTSASPDADLAFSAVARLSTASR